MASDVETLNAAIEASGLSARRFAMEVLAVEERTVRYWLREERAMPGTVVVVCAAIVARPKLASELGRHAVTIQEDRLKRGA